ncbi:polyketide cyclase/dehydrase/lipid transport protein [Haloactinopolyspora alba]|uniref:Polyketide cyclase/dehydrase/lipid transport protein n=1 Tax=Haloactinopolyspora alba TaxID=648780 RepID=A0A2P8DZ30_9ACTN|nr:SRPBCC family protein [Haloactinopolyspora alba]PSL02472.1 polyketide cyclase/dehydrase/lipid transport protein [Haloactinopolyspora alba]
MTVTPADTGSSRRVSASIVVAAPERVIFAILTDPRQHPRIDGSGTVRGVIEGPAELDRGATFGVRMRMFGVGYRISNRVVEFEPDRLIAWRHFAGHRWRYQLDPVGEESTRVTETFDYSRLGPVATAIVRLWGFPEKNRRGIAATLPRLRDAAEADATS